MFLPHLKVHFAFFASGGLPAVLEAADLPACD
jgi:hypothetical protein